VARRALLAHKEDGRLALARPFGLVLATAVRASLEAAGDDPAPSAREGADPPGVWLVPVPSSRAAVQARGHDALLRTARVAASALRGDGVPAGVLPLLRHRRRVADSTGLTTEQRRANLAHSLWVPPALRPLLAIGRVVVVDDVVTTGATLTEAARALAAAGCADVRAATVAATQRRSRLSAAPGGSGARAGPGAQGRAGGRKGELGPAGGRRGDGGPGAWRGFPAGTGVRARAVPDPGVLGDRERLASAHGTVGSLRTPPVRQDGVRPAPRGPRAVERVDRTGERTSRPDVGARRR
jgi:predicted amidophosphoribosyltransferase